MSPFSTKNGPQDRQYLFPIIAEQVYARMEGTPSSPHSPLGGDVPTPGSSYRTRPATHRRGLKRSSAACQRCRKRKQKVGFIQKKTLLTRVLAKVYSPSVTAKHLLVDHVQVSGKHVFPRSVSSFGPIRTSNVTSSEPKSPVFKSRSRLYNFDSATRIPIPPGLRKTQFAEGQPTQVLLSHRDVVGQ